MPSIMMFVVKFAVPLLFALGIRSFFSWRPIGLAVWIATVFLFIGAIFILVVDSSSNKGPYPLMWPAIQLTWYHLLKRFTYGNWKAEPPLLMFRYREDLGSQRDRNFGGIFFLSSLLLPFIILRMF